MRESTFQDRIIRKLKKLPNCWYVKVWGGGFQRAGIPDLLVCYKGYFIGIELKNEVGQATEIQKYNITSIQNAGGYAIILRPQNEQLLWDVISEINQRTTENS